MFYEITPWMLAILLLNMTVAVLSIGLFRFLMGFLWGVNTKNELAKHDNYAFGLVFAGGAIAMGLILSAAVEGDADASYLNEVLNICAFMLAGIALLKSGSFINDRVIFNKISLKAEIALQNLSIGIVQAANFIALGILINALIGWIDVETWKGLAALAVGLASSQLVLLLVTRFRAFVFSRRNSGECLQIALKDNPALAVRYAGHLVSTAIAISAAETLVQYIYDDPIRSAFLWSFAALGLSLSLSIFAFISRKAILHGINVAEEVDSQKNVGVALIEASVFMVVAFIIVGVLA